MRRFRLRLCTELANSSVSSSFSSSSSSSSYYYYYYCTNNKNNLPKDRLNVPVYLNLEYVLHVTILRSFLEKK